MDLSPVDQIKNKLDVVEVLGEYIRLTKAGRNWKARCPFHNERTPSFMVSQERQIWHCFGCGLGGDIFAFIKQIEGVEFPDALRILARKAGVVLKRQDPQVQSQGKRLYEICELTAKFFEVQLEKSAAGQRAKKYLLERKMKPETIKAWRLGWAPDEWRALSEFLKSRGYKDEEILQTGLTIKPETAATETKNQKPKTNYDRFRSRIIFPIFDLQGQIIAFGGRIFGEAAKREDMAKYVNSPQTALYDKSRVLYGLNKNKTEIRNSDQCIIVEGYMDLLMSWQAGVVNVVASSGTALTEEHLNIIGRYTKNLTMAFDSDIAGDSATRRSIDLALAKDFYVKVILMSDKDPADVIKKNSEDWKKIVENAQSIMDFYFSSTFSKYSAKTAEGRREIKKLLLPVIKTLASRTEQSEWLRELARRLGVDEKDLKMDLQGTATIKSNWPKAQPIVNSAPERKSRLDGIEERLLGLCLNHPQQFKQVSDICESDFQNEKLGQIFCALKKITQENESSDTLNRLQKTLSPDLKLHVEYLSLKIQQEPSQEPESLLEIGECLKEFQISKLRQKLVVLSSEIKSAQLEGEKSQLQNLLERFSVLSSQLIELTKNC